MSVPDTMKAVEIDRFGGPEEMRVRDRPVPRPGHDEVLIRVHAAGVGRWDPMELAGEMAAMMEGEPEFPYVLGSDGAGEVAAVGEGVTDFTEGDTVYAAAFLNLGRGFYAEYTPVSADYVARIPAGLDLDAAGAMPSGAVTALCGLDTLQVDSGQSLIIHGASGDVGHLALQLAKIMGVRVMAVASGDDGVALARDLGADAALDGRADDLGAALLDFAPDGVDAALILAPGSSVDTAVAAVKAGGRVAFPNGVMPPPPERDGVDTVAYDGKPGRELLDRLNGLIEEGPFRVHVAEAFGLDRVKEAHAALDLHHIGKHILKPGG